MWFIVIMTTIHAPAHINAAFAEAFNRRDLEALVAMYEPEAVHGSPAGLPPARGGEAIREALAALLAIPGEMTSRNNFCLERGEIALLRADWRMTHEGAVIAEGSTAEIVRRQADGRWLYVIDHPFAATLRRVDE